MTDPVRSGFGLYFSSYIVPISHRQAPVKSVFLPKQPLITYKLNLGTVLRTRKTEVLSYSQAGGRLRDTAQPSGLQDQ